MLLSEVRNILNAEVLCGEDLLDTEVLSACGKSRSDLPPEGQATSAVANGSFKGRPA